MAEAVEKVGADRFCATIVRMSRAFSNIGSAESQILKHCFKNVERPDFFNSLGYKQTYSRPKLKSALPPATDILDRAGNVSS